MPMKALPSHYLQSPRLNQFHILREIAVDARIAMKAAAAMQRVVLYGSGHLAQLAFHAVERAGASIPGICDDDIEAIGSGFRCGVVLNSSQIRFMAPDAVIVADSIRADEMCRSLESMTSVGVDEIRLDTQIARKAVKLAPNDSEPKALPLGLDTDKNPEQVESV